MGSNHEKTGVRKSCDTLPFMSGAKYLTLIWLNLKENVSVWMSCAIETVFRPIIIGSLTH